MLNLAHSTMLKFRDMITFSIGCSFPDLRVYWPRMTQLF
jgi:hypothetical protein